MDLSDWHYGIAPKVKGTWNLHNHLQNHKLDFFVMTSSLTGTIGQATESSYSAANSFLDAFARYRRSLNLAATTVALGAITGIGYLAENQKAEAMLEKQGFRGMDEEQVLELIDIAISGIQTQSEGRSLTITEAPSTLITGLDPSNLIKWVKDDARGALLA